MALVSFAAHIKPLFRPVDVAHMNVHGIKLDYYNYMSDPANNHAMQRPCSRRYLTSAVNHPRCLRGDPIGRKSKWLCSQNGELTGISLKAPA